MTDYQAYYLHLGAVLRKLRMGHGLSVRELSERSCVCDKTIRRLERGTGLVHVRVDTVFRIAEGLGVEPYEIFQRLEERMGR